MEGINEKLCVVAMAFTMLSLGTSPHPLILIFSYLIHELGHIMFSRIAGARMKKFKIGPFHLSFSYDTQGLTYKREMLVQIGGVIFNLLSAFIVYFLPIFNGEGGTFFVACNISLALMNLYPISILDGGGLLKNLFFMIMPEDVAVKCSKAISFVCAILMWLIAVYLQIVFVANLSLFVISVVLLIELCFTN